VYERERGGVARDRERRGRERLFLHYSLCSQTAINGWYFNGPGDFLAVTYNQNVIYIYIYIYNNSFYLLSYLRTPREELLVFYRAPPRVADRGMLTRYDEYRGNKVPGADKN